MQAQPLPVEYVLGQHSGLKGVFANNNISPLELSKPEFAAKFSEMPQLLQDCELNITIPTTTKITTSIVFTLYPNNNIYTFLI